MLSLKDVKYLSLKLRMVITTWNITEILIKIFSVIKSPLSFVQNVLLCISSSETLDPRGRESILLVVNKFYLLSAI